MIRTLYTCLALLSFAGCHLAQDDSPNKGPIKPAFLQEDSLLVDSLLSTLTMEEQVAQLLMVPIYAQHDTNGWAEAERWTQELGLGGVICMQGGPNLQRIRLQRLQSNARIPLMVASDAEWGLGMRLDSTRSFPRAMTLGATRNPELVRMFGQTVGQSLRATGVHVNFAPVVDVNSNPLNPVIGSRSFGESVHWVSVLGQAYADGLQDVHVMATAKHFPGHGDSDSDSHKTLPTISHDRSRLDSIELPPFQYAFDNGMAGVMVAHLDIPSLDSSLAQPSTLSPLIVDSLLRVEMGFEGLAFTDAMSMKGFADFVGERPRIRDALLAGNDILLFPGDPEKAIAEAMSALADGSLDSLSVTEKCRRVLLAKLWCQSNDTIPALGTPWEPKHAEVIHREILAQSLTALPGMDTASVAPFVESQGTLVMLDLANKQESCAPLEAQLKAHLGERWVLQRHVLGKNAAGLTTPQVRVSMQAADRILVTASEMSHRPSRNFGLDTTGVEAVSRALQAWNIPPEKVTVVWMGNPYALKDFSSMASRFKHVLVAYQDDARTCEAVADALCGTVGVQGRLPVSPIKGPWREGDGIDWDGHQRLGRWVEGRGRDWEQPSGLIDSLLDVAIAEEAIPGARVVVAHHGHIVLDKSVGTLDGTAPVVPGSIYDLASITKVVATANALMRLSFEGELDLDWPMSRLMPSLDTLEMGTRTVREFVTHQAGLEPWIPFYRRALADSSGVFGDVATDGCDTQIVPDLFLEEAYQDSIWHMILSSETKPAGEYKYSDLGFYLWRRILEDAGWDIQTWVQRELAESMGWNSMGYVPLERGIDPAVIAPTELDDTFRKGEVRGTVHDPGAAMMDGIGCHAGVFSNAYDLAELGETWLRGGTLKGVELVPERVLKTWTSRGFPDGENRRGCVFDKPALEPDSGPTCDLASWDSFGHTGFTGTLLWVDPVYDLVYVFLSNRTYPDQSNTKLLKLDTRTEIQRVILEHLGATSRFADSP